MNNTKKVLLELIAKIESEEKTISQFNPEGGTESFGRLMGLSFAKRQALELINQENNSIETREFGKIQIMNQEWWIEDLKMCALDTHMVRIVEEYLQDPNCTPYDYIIGEKLTDMEKATFIYVCVHVHKK
jgi:hypothetical protein